MPPTRFQLEGSLRSLNAKLLERLREADTKVDTAQRKQQEAELQHGVAEAAMRDERVGRQVAEEQLTETISSSADLERRMAAADLSAQDAQTQLADLAKRLEDADGRNEGLLAQLKTVQDELGTLQARALVKAKPIAVAKELEASGSGLPVSSSSVETVDSNRSGADNVEVDAMDTRPESPQPDTGLVAQLKRAQCNCFQPVMDIMIGSWQKCCGFVCAWWRRSHVGDERVPLLPQ